MVQDRHPARPGLPVHRRRLRAALRHRGAQGERDHGRRAGRAGRAGRWPRLGCRAQALDRHPVSCAEAEAVYAKWLHDDDRVPTRIVLAAYAANMCLDGDPVWVMLVGGSGIGKTERIMPVASMPHVVMASTLTGEAALLSRQPEAGAGQERDRRRAAADRRAAACWWSRTSPSVLSMSRDRRAEVIAALREVFDGRWDRHYGTDGGQVLHLAGHCGFIAGCTTAIDTAHTVLDAMGTRFLFVRLPDADPGQIGRSALGPGRPGAADARRAGRGDHRPAGQPGAAARAPCQGWPSG